MQSYEAMIAVATIFGTLAAMLMWEGLCLRDFDIRKSPARIKIKKSQLFAVPAFISFAWLSTVDNGWGMGLAVVASILFMDQLAIRKSAFLKAYLYG